jgi:ethanolamine utilization protein EutM
MKRAAVGLIETNGMIAMIAGADAALKSADIQLIGYQIVRQGLVTVM